MRKFFIFIGVVLLFTGCTHFEIITEIQPKISIVERDVGLLYKLGNIQISDTIERIDRDIINYINEEKDKDGTIFTLRVVYNEETSTGLQFLYSINGMRINERTKSPPVDKDVLLANMDGIPGFYLYKLEGKDISDENKEVIEEKIQKVKERVKEESGDKYAPVENKWE